VSNTIVSCGGPARSAESTGPTGRKLAQRRPLAIGYNQPGCSRRRSYRISSVVQDKEIACVISPANAIAPSLTAGRQQTANPMRRGGFKIRSKLWYCRSGCRSPALTKPMPQQRPIPEQQLIYLKRYVSVLLRQPGNDVQ
jgi:hypothetical protein